MDGVRLALTQEDVLGAAQPFPAETSEVGSSFLFLPGHGK